MSDKNNKSEEIKGEDWELVESDSPEFENEAGIENDSEQLAENEEVSQEEKARNNKRTARFIPWIVVLVIIGIVALSTVFLIGSGKSGAENAAASDKTEGDDHNEGESREVKLEPETLASANIEIEGVTQRPAVALLRGRNASGSTIARPPAAWMKRICSTTAWIRAARSSASGQ